MARRLNAVVTIRDRHHSGVAVSIAARLARRGAVPLTVFDVVDDETRREDPDGVDGRVVLVSAEGAGAEVAARVTGRDGALLVFDAFGGGPPGGELFDNDAEALLAGVRQPMLVVGPHVDAPTASWLLAPIDGSTACLEVLPVVERWLATCLSSRVSVVALDPPDPWPPDGTDAAADPARDAVSALRRAGVHADLLRASALDPAAALLALVDGDAVLAVAGPRYRSTPTHWHATARRLIRRATCPILVVPTAG